MFPKVHQSSLGILRVLQLPPPLGHPPLKNPIIMSQKMVGNEKESTSKDDFFLRKKALEYRPKA